MIQSEKEFLEYLVRMLEVIDRKMLAESQRQTISTNLFDETRLMVIGLMWVVDARLHNEEEI